MMVPDDLGDLGEPDPPAREWTFGRVIRSWKAWLGFAALLFLSWLMDNPDTGEVLGGGLFLIGGAVLYFLPSLVARKKHNSGSVFVVNLFFGWTIVGWIVALAMASNNPPTTTAPVAAPTGRTCPFCAEPIQPAAIVCKHCGRDLPPP